MLAHTVAFKRRAAASSLSSPSRTKKKKKVIRRNVIAGILCSFDGSLLSRGEDEPLTQQAAARIYNAYIFSTGAHGEAGGKVGVYLMAWTKT